MNNNQNINISHSSGVNIGSISNGVDSNQPTTKVSTPTDALRQLKELIGQNKFSKALTHITAHFADDADVYDTAILLKSQLTQLQNDHIKGVLSDADYISTKNQLNDRLLQFINTLQLE